MIHLGVWVGAWVFFIIFVIVWYLIRRKCINEAIRKTEALGAELEKRKNEVEIAQKAFDELSTKITAVTIKLAQLDKERVTAIERGREARDVTDRLLKAEHERAAAELGRVKEVEEERLKHEFEEKRKQCEIDLEAKKKVAFDEYWELKDTYEQSINLIKEQLNEYQAKRAAINDAILRERELEEKEDFYRISIKENDTKDIEVLRSIEPRLTNREVLNKLIYEVFIKRPLMEMEKRVLQGRKIGGIYKITYIKTGESYIGRSVDIGNRWKEHCLSSLNIGTIAHSTFHNVLADKGLQNFTWEVLEEVDKDKQSSREKYWIDFYQTDKQYNQKAGG